MLYDESSASQLIIACQIWRATLQAEDMVLLRGHVLEWFYDKAVAVTGHWSRQDGCTAYRKYLKTRITRDVVRWGRAIGRGRPAGARAGSTFALDAKCVWGAGGGCLATTLSLDAAAHSAPPPTPPTILPLTL